MRHQAFTLIEIAFTTVLVTMAILVVGALIPRALRSQEASRYQVLAAAKVQDLMWAFNNKPAIDCIDWEATAGPWDSPAGRVFTAHDIEHKTSSFAFPLRPVPVSIARRLDADNDEIQRILDEGGYIYYCNPTTNYTVEGHLESMAREPLEHRRLIIAVSGPAQQNHIGVFPWKAWPYYRNYPVPPVYKVTASVRRPWGGDQWAQHTAYDNLDQDVYFMWHIGALIADRVGAIDAAGLRTSGVPQAYFANAYWLAKRRGVTLGSPWLLGTHADDATLRDWQHDARAVDALGRLAHAAMTLTRYFTKAELDAGIDLPDLDPDVAAILTPNTIPGGAGVLTVTLDMIRAYHENSLRLAMAHAAHHPYDWGAFRPLNRAIMMDVPLIQWDLWPSASRPLLSGSVNGTNSGGIPAAPATQWRPIAAEPMDDTRLGPAVAADLRTWFPTNTADGRRLFPPYSEIQPRNYFNPTNRTTRVPKLTVAWGDQANFTLTRPFDPSERCRQIVVWAVDWQSYEDFETAPSAPVDASRYPLAESRQGYFPNFIYRMGVYQNWNYQSAHINDLWFNGTYMHTARNPERENVFAHPVAGLATGADISLIMCGPDFPDRHDRGIFADSVIPVTASEQSYGGYQNRTRDQGHAPNRTADANPRYVFSGLWGADRNYNLKLDRGPIPAGVRLRATTVARYNVYDPRLPMTFR